MRLIHEDLRNNKGLGVTVARVLVLQVLDEMIFVSQSVELLEIGSKY